MTSCNTCHCSPCACVINVIPQQPIVISVQTTTPTPTTQSPIIIGPGQGGAVGPQGTQGVQGAQGAQGTQGTQGAQGTQGTQGTQGVQGVQGTQGVQGNLGLQGIQGPQGTQGIQGEVGLQGIQGIQGEIGAQGVSGTQGIDGLQGVQGIQGHEGAQGIYGVQGATGTQGFNGTQGTQGLQGEIGVQGFTGTQGFVGIQGIIGLQGIQGETGTQGFTGTQGAVGTQGLEGHQGTQGIQGEVGLQGFTGLQGVQGVQGNVGAQGVQGTTGAGGTIAYYGVFYDANDQTAASPNTAYPVKLSTTVENNSVNISNDTNGNPTKINFVHPGTYDIQFSAQLTTTSSNKEDVQFWIGIDGTPVTESNTQITVQGNGQAVVAAWNWVFTVTANQYVQLFWATTNTNVKITGSIAPLDSGPNIPSVIVTATQVTYTIQGTTGAQGTVGSQGTTGSQGAQGTQGVQGKDGTDGADGAQGTQGTLGIQGIQGQIGIQGTTGTQGLTGAQGTNGTQGAQGAQGLQGLQGTTGSQGTTGTQGLGGAQGTQGIQGHDGSQGTTGVQGFTGTQGAQGLQGIQGLQGTQGLQGLQGLLGDDGFVAQDTPPSNTSLLWLDTSVQATAGLQGPQGTAGYIGTNGAQGTQGIQGTIGDDGFVAQTNAPTNTSLLWLDTDEPAVEAQVALDEVIATDPTGAYFDGTGLRFANASGNVVNSPDAAALDITGDIDIRAKVALDNWSSGAVFVNKYQASNRSYEFYINTSGNLGLTWTADGTTQIAKTSTATVGFTNGATKWVRATLDVDNGASGNDVIFYTSDDGSTWTKLGNTVTTAGTTSIFSGTAPLDIGARTAATAILPQASTFYRIQILNGIGGTTVFDADFSAVPADSFAFTESSSNAATVTLTTTRYHFGVPSIGSGALGTLAINGNRTFYFPIKIIGKSITLKHFAFEVTTAPTSTATARMAIYAADTQMQPTGNPLVNSGAVTVSNAAGAVYRVRVTPTTIPAGNYLIAFNITQLTSVRIFTSGLLTPILNTIGSNMINSFWVAQTLSGDFAGSQLKWNSKDTGTAAGGIRYWVFLGWS